MLGSTQYSGSEGPMLVSLRQTARGRASPGSAPHEADLAGRDLDLGPGRRTGIEICRRISARAWEGPHDHHPHRSRHDRDAVAAFKAGARATFITKDPYLEDKSRFFRARRRGASAHALRFAKRLEDENASWRDQRAAAQGGGPRWQQIVGDSQAMRMVRPRREGRALRGRARARAARHGKELVGGGGARDPHALSPRASEP